MRPKEGLVVLVRQDRSMKEKPPLTYWRMMFSEMMLSFLASFFFFFIVFLINQVLLFAEDILSRGADLVSVSKLLFYSLPTIIAIAVPFSVLTATLMTSSRQHADNEFLASSTLGIRPLWLYIPFLIVGIGIAVGSFYANDWFIPRAANGFKTVYAELIRKSAKVELSPYTISKYGDKLLVTGASSATLIQNLLIIDQKQGADANVVTADDVSIEFSQDSMDAILKMNNITEEKKLPGGEPGDFSMTTARQGDIRIQIREQIPSYSSTAPSEMSVASLARQIKEKESRLASRLREKESQKATALDRLRLSYAQSSAASSALASFKSLASQKTEDTSLQIYRLEYQKKFVIPSACLFFAFLAFPLGIGSRRAGRTAGFGLALLLAVIYWALLFAGQTFGYRQGFDPALSMWMPNFVMFAAACFIWISRKIFTGHFL
jgi:lipopolysaccharide export system permease protein